MKKDGTSELKLSVLTYIMDISKYAKIMGIYNNLRPKLRTDRLIGNTTASLGFIKTSRYFVPNTVLKDDVRNNVEKSERILAILSKAIKEPNYNKIESVAKKINIAPILEKLSDSVAIKIDTTEIFLPDPIDKSKIP